MNSWPNDYMKALRYFGKQLYNRDQEVRQDEDILWVRCSQAILGVWLGE